MARVAESTEPEKEDETIGTSSTNFSEYTHMENETKIFAQTKELDITWFATEKIHGTNYSLLYMDGQKVIPCRRGAELGDDRTYYAHGKLYDKYSNNVIVMFNLLKTSHPMLKGIQVYGELFGGWYNGKTAKDSKRVQVGVCYAPFNEFLVFDIKMIFEDKSYYVDFGELLDVFTILKSSEFLLDHVPLIKVGRLDELLTLNPKFESVVYEKYGLDKIENNFAEGFVVHPAKEYRNIYGDRIIFKFKNPSFSEVVERVPKVHAEKKLTPEQEFAKNFSQIVKNYTTKTRFDNVFTKLVDPTEKDLVEAMIKDIQRDIISDYSGKDIVINEETFVKSEKMMFGVVSGYVKRFMTS